jgi:Peptidase family S41
MKRWINLGLLSAIFATQVPFAQEAPHLRTLNEVVFEFYKPWDEAKLESKIPAKLLREDVDLFVKTIEDIGVNPYINLPKEDFYFKIDRLKRTINEPITRQEFLRMFVPVVNSLKLSHTFVKSEIWFDKRNFDKKGGTYFPLQVRIENSRIVLDKDYAPSHLHQGDEILSVNNIPSKTLVERLLSYSSEATAHSKIMEIQEDFPVLLWWVYEFSGTFRVNAKGSNFQIKGLTSGELDRLYPNPQDEEDYKQYEFDLINASTAKLVFRDFGIKDIAGFHSFLDSTFQEIRNKSIRNLIIDVRANAGGNDEYIEVVKYLYDKPFKSNSKILYKKSRTAEDFFLLFLNPEDRNDPAKRKAINTFGSCEAQHNYGESYECEPEIYTPKPDSIRFKGNLLVLSDYRTTSAGVDFVGLIKDYGIGKIIGTETDQSPSNDANGCYFLLPHSNVMALGATIYEVRVSGDPNTTRGVIPDYEVSQSKAATAKGIDTIMEFAMKLVEKK